METADTSRDYPLDLVAEVCGVTKQAISSRLQRQGLYESRKKGADGRVYLDAACAQAALDLYAVPFGSLVAAKETADDQARAEARARLEGQARKKAMREERAQAAAEAASGTPKAQAAGEGSASDAPAPEPVDGDNRHDEAPDGAGGAPGEGGAAAEAVRALSEQLKVKDEQIAAKDEQISQLMAQVESQGRMIETTLKTTYMGLQTTGQAQMLHAASSPRLSEAPGEDLDLDEPDEEHGDESPEPADEEPMGLMRRMGASWRAAKGVWQATKRKD